MLLSVIRGLHGHAETRGSAGDNFGLGHGHEEHYDTPKRVEALHQCHVWCSTSSLPAPAPAPATYCSVPVHQRTSAQCTVYHCKSAPVHQCTSAQCTSMRLALQRLPLPGPTPSRAPGSILQSPTLPLVGIRRHGCAARDLLLRKFRCPSSGMGPGHNQHLGQAPRACTGCSNEALETGGPSQP